MLRSGHILLNRKDGETLALAETEDPSQDTVKALTSELGLISFNPYFLLLQDTKFWMQRYGLNFLFSLEAICPGAVYHGSTHNAAKHREENLEQLQVPQASPGDLCYQLSWVLHWGSPGIAR